MAYTQGATHAAPRRETLALVALFAGAAAIANAVEDAVGVRITDLPITAEKVYRALKAKRA